MNKLQAGYVLALVILIFLLGGVLLNATGLEVFTEPTAKQVSILTMTIIILLITCLYQLSKTYNR